MDEMSVGQEFTEALIGEVRQHSSLVWAPCHMRGPSAPDERVDYRALREQGIDTVLEAGVAGFGLSGPELAVDPLVAVKVTARVRLVRVENNSLVYEETSSYSGQSRKFLEWARDGGRSFRVETSTVCRRLAAMIVEKLSPAVFSPDPVVDRQK